MQFKDFFKNRNIIFFIIVAVILFLLLPVIFPEETPIKFLKKESIYSHEDSPLPIFPKDDLIKKYAKRFKKFYHIGKRDDDVPPTPEETVEQIQEEAKEIDKIRKARKIKETEEKPSSIQQPESIEEKKTTKEQTIGITREDLFFANDREDNNTNVQVKNYESRRDTSVNSSKPTIVTKDGLTLHPTNDGYYYKDKFYKNGTYPKNADKRHIEGALSRYHNRVAKRLSKKAIYFADEQGNLTVSYVDELPEGASADIDTYRERSSAYNFTNRSNNTNNFNSTNNQDTYKQYQNQNNNSQDKNIDYSDIAAASISSMHAAYNLVKEKINSGEMTQGININKPFENALVNNFLNNHNTQSNGITSDNPTEPQIPPANPEDSDTVVAGDQNFAQDYANKIHELNCGKDTEESLPAQTEPAPFVPAAVSIIQVGKNNFSCDNAPLIVEPSSSITNTVSQETDLDRFTNELNGITTQSDKTDINIISTDRNFYPVASKLNDEESIRNNNDAPVTVHIIGPNENEADLSKVLESVTYSITDDTSVADKLTDDLTNFYALTQEENTGIHTILAFPTDDENKVFILTDPNNSYWLKNPSQLDSLPVQYMEKNGVYYKGVIVNKIQIGDLVQEERTNLLYISDSDFTHALQNGSVLTTVKEEDIKINSLHPQQIQQNAEMVRALTEKGQEQLSKQKHEQQPGQQPIEIIDFEKGNKIIQPKI